MSQSAVVPEQVCLRQTFELCHTVTLSYSLEGMVPQAWCRGQAVVEHRSSKVLCDRRTAHVAVSVERSRHMLMSAMS